MRLIDEVFVVLFARLRNTVSCPLKSNSETIELTVQTSCYWGLRLTLCFLQGFLDFSRL